MAARLFVGHHRRPDFMGIEIVAGVVEQALGSGFENAVLETLANQTALTVATVGVEAVADHATAVLDDIGDHGDQAQRHFREIDVGVADVRLDRLGFFADVENFHVRCRVSGA